MAELIGSGTTVDETDTDEPELDAKPLLSALIRSAAFSATAYTLACRCAAGINGNIPASTTRRFCVP